MAPGLILQVLRRAPAADRPSGGALRQLGAPVEPPVESAGVESAGVESAGVESAGVESGCDAPRIGYTASRKVGIAVARNRARRRLRAAVAEVMPRCAAPGHDYVLVARAATLKRPYAALVEDLRTALRRLDVFREPPLGEQASGARRTGRGSK